MYSMSTKTAEYMISGVPILVYAPIQTALAKYAKEEEWAYLIDTNKKNVLFDALKELYSNIDLRRLLANKAKAVAIKNHDAINVRNQFREVFIYNKREN